MSSSNSQRLREFWTNHPVVAWGGTTISVVLSIIGLAGIPDDVQTWGTWLASFQLTSWVGALTAEQGIRIALVAIGVAVFLLVNVVPVFATKRLRHIQNISSGAALPAPPVASGPSPLSVALQQVSERGRDLIKGTNPYSYSAADYRATSSVWLSEVIALTEPSEISNAAKKAKAAISNQYVQLLVTGELSTIVQLLEEHIAGERIRRLRQADEAPGLMDLN